MSDQAFLVATQQRFHGLTRGRYSNAPINAVFEVLASALQFYGVVTSLVNLSGSVFYLKILKTDLQLQSYAETRPLRS